MAEVRARNSKSSPAKPLGTGFTLMAVLLAVVLTLMLGGAFLPGKNLFSNDGPLGRLMTQCHHLPDRFTGCWEDLNTVGYSEGAAVPNVTFGLQLLLGPIIFSKFYAAIGLLILGLGAWCFFRQLGLVPAACLLGGLAATLNSSFFSAACWGIAAHPTTVGLTFFALAALVDTTSPKRWLRVALAGLAVGLGVSEGADVGALFSVFVAAFLIYQTITSEGSPAKNIPTGAARLGLVVFCAIFLAAQAISQLAATNIEGVAGTQQDTQTVATRWDWATKWSLPKKEALALVMPGLFGYRVDTHNGGNYWGSTGQDLEWEKYLAGSREDRPPPGWIRFTGGGSYAGVAVALVGIWAVAQMLRREHSVFSGPQRKWLWFWLVVCVGSLLLAFGRYAPFYRIIYQLPYMSTIRNPTKFLHVFSFALVVLFAYGVDGLWRGYLRPAAGRAAPTGKFEKFWNWGCLLVLAVSLVGWAIYAGKREALEEYLLWAQFSPILAKSIAAFSIAQVWWFVLFFVLGAGLVAAIQSGRFTGQRAALAGTLLGLLLVVDLARANYPWVMVWDYEEQYSSNPVVDRFRQQPYEHRVANFPFGPNKDPLYAKLNDIYRSEWLPHLFPYYNVQSVNVVQLPRKPVDMVAFDHAMFPTNGTPEEMLVKYVRYWQVTNTRYLVGMSAVEAALAREPIAAAHPFRVVSRFSIIPRAGVVGTVGVNKLTAITAPNGPYSIYEFTGALPRAKLYSNWQSNTNDAAVLEQLADPAFDPEKTLIVGHGLAANLPVAGTNQNAGTASFASYRPKDVVLKTDAPAAAILLLNDRFDPNWNVTVDDKPAPLLRCNYLMRGVYLEAGPHMVEFKFQPREKLLYVSLAAMALGTGLLGMLFIGGTGRGVPATASVPTQPTAPIRTPQPARQPAKAAGKRKPATAKAKG